MTNDNVGKQPKPLVWVVDSAYTGELHARIGLAERLGFGYQTIPLPNDDASGYQQALKHKYLANINTTPLLVISGTGEETTAEIADLRQVFTDCLFNVYLASILPEQPHPRLHEYDLIASPQLTGDNVVTMTGVPHQLTQAGLAASYRQHTGYFDQLPKPITALLVGGNTRYCNGFSPDHARQLAGRVTQIVNTQGGSLMVTNSRRTPVDALSVLLTELSGFNPLFFDWQQTATDFYHALLAHADVFIVTGDSLSMCSEAAFTGKPLLVDLSANATECFHREIIHQLIDYGAAKLLTGDFEPWRYTPPDPTGEVAAAIHERLGQIQLGKAYFS
ncbi:MAG: ELM1/GtrOC1 family putative glycosyltransferase [Methylovulum sp.]|nr:ELM1/GtrOC1 family putative glycosyltransferase [Methylovulum sp.]